MTRAWRPGAIDRYIFAQAALRLLATVVVVVVVMTLENAPRLTADLRHADAPAALLLRLSLYLVPEHLAIALPVGVLVAVALTARTLANRGEWQMLAAAGMSPARVLAAPTTLAALAAVALLGNALSLRPAGERALDALYAELVGGDHGVAVPLREPVHLDAETTLVADGAGPTGGELSGVLVRRAGATMSARRARVVADGRGGIALVLGAGASVEHRSDGTVRRMHFEGLTLKGRPPVLDLVPGNLRHRLDRLGGVGLWRLAGGSEPTTLRDAGRAALLTRIEGAFFCLLLPWLAVALGVPARRQAGGPALLVGVVLIVLHLQGAALVEDAMAAHAVAATFAHAAFWVAVTAAIVRLVRRRGDGAIDLALVAAARTARTWLVPGGPLPGLARVGRAVLRSTEVPPGGGLPAVRPALRGR